MRFIKTTLLCLVIGGLIFNSIRLSIILRIENAKVKTLSVFAEKLNAIQLQSALERLKAKPVPEDLSSELAFTPAKDGCQYYFVSPYLMLRTHRSEQPDSFGVEVEQLEYR